MSKALATLCLGCQWRLLTRSALAKPMPALATAPLQRQAIRRYTSATANERSPIHPQADALRRTIHGKMRSTLGVASVNDSISPKATYVAVVRLARQLQAQGVPFDAETYELLLGALSKNDRADEILPLLHKMRADDVTPTFQFFHKALHLAAGLGDSELQARILEKMHDYKYPMTSKVYQKLFFCMRQNGELERALDTLEEMKRKSIAPSVSTLGLVFDIAILYKEPKIAYDLLQQAAASHEHETFHTHAIRMHHELLRCAATNGSYEVVKKCWREGILGKRCEPDEGLITQILFVAADHKDPELASQVFRAFGEHGYTYKTHHFETLMESFAALFDWKSTFRLLGVMRSRGLKPDKRLARALMKPLTADSGQVHTACQALEELYTEENAVDVVAFNMVLYAFAYKNQFEICPKLGVDPNVETLETLLDACIHARKVAEGVEYYNSFAERGMQSQTAMSKMVVLACTEEDYEIAFDYLEDMKSRGITPLRGCLYRLVKKMAETDDDRLPLALDDMAAYGYEVTPFLNEHIERWKERHHPTEEPLEDIVRRRQFVTRYGAQ
ncbi:hypothetical protein BCR43DRAFT_485595 [Syncephalastrum racemosum]|uniref:Pentatricopeptide repeat-containing protein-mitochondrial domain-containing protein n=1 Tax=Syncephalastrum racemosum TaxID=13706 RepID=A0A1X2HMV4_SYNRA|nr:hypothetical protein BCR43DRAFT_485595 [Syncephalastrum racemosum]